jgi:hypothetical protein
VTGTINYDAFGGVVSSSGSTNTIFMFAGDAVYDPASGLDFNGDGIRERRPGQPDFIERDDQGYSYNGDPISLNAEIYGDGDPVDNHDPSGHYSYSPYTTYGLVGGDGGIFGDSSLDGMASTAGAIFAGVGGLIGTEALAPLFGAISTFEGIEGGIANATLAPSGVNDAESFGVGFASSFTSSILSDAGVPCWIASGVGGAILTVGNDYLANPNNFSLTQALQDVAVGGLAGVLQGGYCFVAETPVLLGDRKTRRMINGIHVGQRVATDEGLANSADDETKTRDPSITVR